MVPEPEKTYIIMPKTEERASSVSILPLLQARSINQYNFYSSSAIPSIDEIKRWTEETIVVKEWDGYYYSKHMIAEYPEVFFYIFYRTGDFAPVGFPPVWYSFFVLPISSKEVSAVQVGDPYSKLQEQSDFFPDVADRIEFVYSDGKILFCQMDETCKIVDVRPGLNKELTPKIKEILEFEAAVP